MTGIWALADVALADIENNGAFYPDLASAVAAASSGDTLVFDGGTYEAEGVVISGVALTFQGNGSTLTADSGSRMVELQGGATLTASGLTFESAVARAIDGGSDSTITLNQVTIGTAVGSGNGGGIQLLNPIAVTLTDVTFDGATAIGSGSNGQGGALWVSGATSQVVLDGVVFDTTFGTTRGGAVYAEDTDLRCVDCRFVGTSGAEGGAIYATGAGALTLERCGFEATSASSGGAVHTSVPTTVIEGTFCGTAASTLGGAIYATVGGGTVANTVFLDAEAGNTGSALYAQGPRWTVTNAHVLSGAGTSAFALDGDHTVANTLFAFNTGGGVSSTAGALTHHHNAYWASNPAVTGGTSPTDVAADPLLAGFVDDGICGNDQLWPGFGSPLVDAGDPALQDPDGSRSDIGAFGGPDADPTLFDDGDGDGFPFLDDCDDAEPASHPAPLAEEVCDGVDNDCSGGVDDNPANFPTWFEDCDADGQGDLSTAATQCVAPATACAWLPYDPDAPENGSDCDDTDPDVFLGADEYCTTTDEDCDGIDGLQELGVVDGTTFYVDGDGDGHGDPLRAVQACSAFTGLSVSADDCDDTSAAVYPGAPDTCGDAADTDCSGADGTPAEEALYRPDLDRDSFGDREDVGTRGCEAPPGGPWVVDGSDCDDTTSFIRPGAAEVCDGVDQDCDDLVDDVEGVPEETWFRDVDGDGFGDGGQAQTTACGQPPGFVDRAGDCDDDERDVNPEATEVCNDVDDDCDELVDLDDDTVEGTVLGWKDADGDSFGGCPAAGDCDGQPLCELGEVDGIAYVGNGDDCFDEAADVSPSSAEVPGNSVDENCDGKVAPGSQGDEEEPSGCNCDQSGAPPVGLAALLALAVLRRRR